MARVGPTQGTIAWAVDISIQAYSSYPIVGADGTVFNGPNAFNSSGIVWNAALCGGQAVLFNAYALDANGILYGACTHGVMFAAPSSNATTAIWTLQLAYQRFQSAVTLGASMLYVGCDDGRVYAASTAGTRLWNYTTSYIVSATPALSVDGSIVYAASTDASVYALAANTGALLWRFTAGDAFYANPVVTPCGSVIVASRDANLYALDGKLGTKLWLFQTSSPLVTTPVVSPGGVVYFSVSDGAIYAAKAQTGLVVWVTMISPSPVMADMALTPTTLYGSSYAGLYGLDTVTGAVVLNSTAGAALQAPVIGPEGFLIGVNSNNLAPRVMAFQ